MNDTIRAYLFDLAQAATDALEFLQDVSFAEFSERKLVRAGVKHELIIVGEAMTRVKREAPEIAATLTTDVRGIIAFRNRLAHGYDTVDNEIVYKIATRDLPALRQEVLALLESSQ
ncbi:MAG: HepT-like ribonuclease domain-containing protein [Armatimonadia bacterium]